MDRQGLKRVILIDSYMPGVVTEIKIDGHTNITGRNGFGKTSFLRLLPIFYGDNPSNHIKRDEGKNFGFAKYYLPRLGSAIIYEYQVGSILKTAVFTALPTSDSQYRQIFIDAGFDLSLFVDTESGNPFDSSGLISRISSKGYAYLAVKTNKEYRNVLLESSGGQYSLSRGRKKLSNLTPLLSSMFKKEANFDDLALFVQDWCKANLESDARRNLESLSINKRDIDAILLDFDSISKVNLLKDKAPELRTSIDNLSRVIADLVAIRTTANVRVVTNGQFVDESTEKVQLLSSEITTEKKRWQLQSESLSALISSLSEETSLSDEAIKNIESQYKRYIDSEAPSYKLVSQQITERESARERQEEALTRSKLQVSEVVEQANIVRSKIEAASAHYSDEMAESASELARTYTVDSDDADKAMISALNEFDKTTQTWLNEQQVEVEASRNALATANAELKVASASPALLKSMEEALAAVRKTQIDKDETDGKIKEQELVVTAIKNRWKAKNDDLDECFEKESKVNKQIGQLTKERDGEPGTLFNFLTESDISWRETIGKVVSRELLFTKGLAPSIESEGDTLFGLNLDLGSLIPVATDPEVIEGQIDHLAKQQKSIEFESKEIEKVLNTIFKSQQQEQDILNALQSKFKNQERALDQLNNAYDTICRQVENDKVDAKKRLAAQLEAAQESFESVNEKCTSYLKVRVTERQIVSDKLSQTKIGIQTRYDATIENIKQQRKTAAANKALEITALDDSLRLALEGKGVAQNTIEELENTINDIKKEVLLLKKNESYYGAYLQFLGDDYAKLGDMKLQNKVLQTQFEDAKKQRQDELGKHSDFLVEKNKLLTNLEESIDQKQKETKRLESSLLADEIILNLTGIASDDDKARWALNETPSLINEGNKIVSELSSCRRSVKNLITDFTEGFTLYVGSISHKYWTEHVLPNGHNDPAIAKSVIQYFNTGEHEENVKAVLQRLQILNNIDTYRRHIERFSSKVSSFNRQLNNHISDSMAFHAISDIRVNIDFSPERLDHWSDIEKVSKHYEAWMLDERQMPSQDLINSLRNFSSRIPAGTVQSSNTELWRQIKFSVDLMENGNPKHITSEQGLKNPSSNGLSYLILIVVFLGFIDMHRSDNTVSLSWSLDELGNIDEENTRALLKLLTERNVFLVSACPHVSHAMQGAFKYRYFFQKKEGRSFVVDLSRHIKIDNPFDTNVMEAV